MLNCALQIAQMVATKLTPSRSATSLQRLHPRQRALDAQVEELVGQKAPAGAAAERPLVRRLRRHLDVVVGDGADDRARDLELAAGCVAHPRGPGDVAGIVKGDDPVVVGRRVERQCASPDQVPGEFADVRGLAEVRVELALQRLRERVGPAGADAGERVPEAVGDAPGVTALADDDALDAEVQRRLAHPQRHPPHVLVAADEQAEVARFRSVRRQRPGNPRRVEDLGIADQAVDVRLGEEVGRRHDEQDVGALFVDREAHVDAGFVLDVLLEAFQRVGERGAGQAEVVADPVDLGDDLVRVLLAETDAVHDLLGRHRDLGGVDSVRAEHRAAPALGALVVVGVPLVEHVAGQLARADQLREQLAGQREVPAVDAAHQFLARDRHVQRVLRADEVMALLGAGAAAHARVHVDLERAVLAQELAHLGERLLLPVGHEFAGEAQRFLDLVVGDVGARGRHRAGNAAAAGRRDRAAAGP